MLNFFSIKKEDKIFYLILVVAIYFMLIIKGLENGGRWDLNDQIFTGVRIFEDRTIAFLRGSNQGFNSVSCYPYFQPLLLGLASKLINHRTLEMFMIIAFNPIISIALYIKLIDISLKINPISNLNIRKIYILTCALILWLSDTYVLYASEGKPDSLSLLFLCFAIDSTIVKYDVNAYGNKLNKIEILKIGFFIFFACSTKQQILPSCIFLSFYIAYITKSIWKFFILNSFVFLSILIPSLMMNGYFFSVYSAYAGNGFKDIVPETITSIKYLSKVMILIFIVLLIMNKSSIFLILKKSQTNLRQFLTKINKSNFPFNLKSNLEIFFYYKAAILTAFIIYSLGQTMSAYKYGGNQGNFQVGLIPIFFILLPTIFNLFLIDTRKKIKLKKGSFILLALISISILTFHNVSSFRKLGITYYKRDTYLINNLKDKLKNNNLVVVDSNTMMHVKEIGIKYPINIYDAFWLSISSLRDESGGNLNEHIINNTDVDNEFNYFLKNPLEKTKSKKVKSKTHSFKYMSSIKLIKENCLYKERYCLGRAKVIED